MFLITLCCFQSYCIEYTEDFKIEFDKKSNEYSYSTYQKNSHYLFHPSKSQKSKIPFKKRKRIKGVESHFLYAYFPEEHTSFFTTTASPLIFFIKDSIYYFEPIQSCSKRGPPSLG